MFLKVVIVSSHSSAFISMTMIIIDIIVSISFHFISFIILSTSSYTYNKVIVINIDKNCC